MTDQQLASQWDADHRLAAITTLVSGALIILGTALVFTVGVGPIEALVNAGTAPAPFAVNLLAGVFLIVDVALLVFVVALAHTFSGANSFALSLTTGVATLATTSAATVHLIWGHIASALEFEAPPQVNQFATWLAANLWILPLFGLLVGATLVALALALRGSPFRVARRLGTASAVIGGVLVVLAPFTGFGPGALALAAVAEILLATAGISVLLVVALVTVGLLLFRSRHHEPVPVA